MRFDRKACTKIEATLNQRLATESDRLTGQYPLLGRVRRTSDRARKIFVDADVRTTTLTATYDVPCFGSGADQRLDASMTTLDRVIPFVDRYAVSAMRGYERDICLRLYQPRDGFFGLEGVVPTSGP